MRATGTDLSMNLNKMGGDWSLNTMKKFFTKVLGLGLVGAMGAMGVSCSTSYDAYGKRQQSVSPGGAAIGAVALGALAYSVGKNDGKRRARREQYRSDAYHGYDRYDGRYDGRGGFATYGNHYEERRREGERPRRCGYGHY